MREIRSIVIGDSMSTRRVGERGARTPLSLKIIFNSGFLTAVACTKSVFGRRCWGSLQRSPNPLTLLLRGGGEGNTAPHPSLSAVAPIRRFPGVLSCQSVTRLHPAETAERIGIRLESEALEGPRNMVLGCGPHPQL